MRRTSAAWAVLAVTLLATPQAGGQGAVQGDVILATTTSTQDSGLMDVLVPMFERRSGYRVKTISAGTGQTLAMGARGDADVVLGHAPELEKRYVAEGVFVTRRLVMYNDFVLVGPPADPAKIRQSKGLTNVFRRLADSRTTFVSRADKSGTHLREVEIWTRAGVMPTGDRYIQTGQGQGATLKIASEKGAYALTDRGTFLALRKHLALEIVFEGARRLLNVYHVMEINSARHPKINQVGGRAFADFLVSAEAQKAIEAFGVDRFGAPLFVPAGGKNEDDIQVQDRDS